MTCVFYAQIQQAFAEAGIAGVQQIIAPLLFLSMQCPNGIFRTPGNVPLNSPPPPAPLFFNPNIPPAMTGENGQIVAVCEEALVGTWQA
jgi:hypothetical protein